MHEHLRAGVCDVGALRCDTRGGRLEKRRDKKMLRRCLLLQELFFFFPAWTHRGSEEEGELRRRAGRPFPVPSLRAL